MNKLFMFTAGTILGIVLAGVAHTKAEQQEEVHVLNGLEYANYKTLEYKIQIIEAYNAYYKEVESVLDTLNLEYDWVDSYDFQSYYESRDKLNYLWSLEDDCDPNVNKE